jgi:hypothetical protein
MFFLRRKRICLSTANIGMISPALGNEIMPSLSLIASDLWNTIRNSALNLKQFQARDAMTAQLNRAGFQPVNYDRSKATQVELASLNTQQYANWVKQDADRKRLKHQYERVAEERRSWLG